jgi:hypothetical protein
MIYIKNLPKDILLYRLWYNAKYIKYLKNLKINLNLKRAKKDIDIMLINERKLNLTTYYGKRLFIDLSSDYLDILAYEASNGRGIAIKIINDMKKEEIIKIIALYLINNPAVLT